MISQPLFKTLRTIKQANLFFLMIACAILGILFVFFCVSIITWFSVHLIDIKTEWLDTVVTWIIGCLTGIGGWFMLPACIVLISGIFQETVIHRVETVFYPDKVRKEGPKLWPDVVHDIKFTILSVLLNLLILPFYLISIGLVMSILLNTYLLGREFFESAAGYHMGKPVAKQLGKNNWMVVYSGGLIITLITLVPLINLFVPILATVWMVHAFHGIKNKPNPAL
jgi:CysZ protein